MHIRIFALLMLFVSLAFCAFGQSVHQIAVPDSSGYPRVVDHNNPLPVEGSVSVTIGDVDTVSTQTVTLEGGVDKAITSNFPSDKTRQWMKISAPSYESEIWVSYNSPAVVGACELYYGFAVVPVAEDIQVHVIASTAMSLFVVEGGK